MSAIFEGFPTAPDWRFDWDALRSANSWAEAMAATEQDPVHHAEGDVWTHTRMVAEAMLELETWQRATDTEKTILLAAALLHDIAKPETTRRENGRVTARGHSRRGAIVVRGLLWKLGVPFLAREQIAALVCHHQIPFFLLEKADPRRTAYRVSQTAVNRLLAAVTMADARGRHCADKQRLVDNVELFSEFCREHACLDGPRRFGSSASRFEYFRKADRDPDYVAFDETKCEVTLMSGLPASGKDTWIARNAPDTPVVSLDQIRTQLGVKPTDKQGPVVFEARERAKGFLRRKEHFVWNATSISRQMRELSIGLFASYGARIRIVYLEAPERVIEKRNSARERPVPAKAMRSMIDRWEVPDLTEAHEIVWAVTGS